MDANAKRHITWQGSNPRVNNAGTRMFFSTGCEKLARQACAKYAILLQKSWHTHCRAEETNHVLQLYE